MHDTCNINDEGFHISLVVISLYAYVQSSLAMILLEHFRAKKSLTSSL